jgi:hypothetical protein
MLGTKRFVLCLLGIVLGGGCGTSEKDGASARSGGVSSTTPTATSSVGSADKSTASALSASQDRMKRFRDICDGYAAAVDQSLDKTKTIIDDKSALAGAEAVTRCADKIGEYTKEMKSLGHFNKAESKELRDTVDRWGKATDRQLDQMSELRKLSRDPKFSPEARKALFDAQAKSNNAWQDFSAAMGTESEPVPANLKGEKMVPPEKGEPRHK